MIKVKDDIEAIKGILRKNPNDPHWLRAAARGYLREGQYKLAKDYYTQAVGLCPSLLPRVLLEYEEEIIGNPEKIGFRLSLAAFKLWQGETDSSLLELEESLEINSKNAEIYNVLGRIYVKQERIDDVIPLLERSVAEGIRDVALAEILAGAYLEKGKIQDAIKFYQEVLNYKPGDKQTLRVLGELYTRIEEYNRAAKSFEAMFSDDPEVSREVVQRLEGLLEKVEGNVFIREMLADIYMRSINPEAAVAKLTEILRLDPAKLLDVISKLRGILRSYPGHPSATLALAEAWRIRGNFSEAVEAYYNLVKSRPEFLEGAMDGYRKILELCPEQILARSYLAEGYLYRKQISQALDEFENMVRIDPTTAEHVIAKCREIIKSNPQLFLARLVLGRAYLVKGDTQRAALEAEGIVAIDKSFTAAYLLLGEVYFKLKLCRKAVGVLKTALMMEPYNLFVQEQYRMAKEKGLELEIESIKERLAGDQWKISLHLDLAKLYIKKRAKEDAIRELQLAVRDQARAAFAYDFLGRVYRREGRFDMAAAQFNRAKMVASTELVDFGRMVQFNLGTTCEGRGDVNGALAIYESILQEDIDFGNLKQKIEILKSCSLYSLRDKALVAVVSEQAKGEIIALWGREGRMGQGGRKESMSVSFGQNYNTSGFEYFMKGMYKAAIEEFSLAVQLDAGFAVALNNLGISLAREGKLKEAKIRIENAVHLDPNSVVLRNNLGVIYLLLGDIERAKQELEKAIRFSPGLSAVCINLGDVYYLKKDAERAVGLYRKVGGFEVLSDIAGERLLYKVPD
jgi:tetratricopeptide (TPR) repeat protein